MGKLTSLPKRYEVQQNFELVSLSIIIVWALVPLRFFNLQFTGSLDNRVFLIFSRYKKTVLVLRSKHKGAADFNRKFLMSFSNTRY